MPDVKVKSRTKKPNPEIKTINEQFSDTFKGIDKIRDNKNDEDLSAAWNKRLYQLRRGLDQMLTTCRNHSRNGWSNALKEDLNGVVAFTVIG